MQPDTTNPGFTQGTRRYSDSSNARSMRTSTSEDGTIIESELPSCICNPASPSFTSRYRLKRTIQDARPEYKIQPFSTSFPHVWSLPENWQVDPRKTRGTLPPGWQRHVHPEGLPYFFLPQSPECPMRVVTEEWLYDTGTFALIRGAIENVCDKISQHQAIMRPDSDLFVGLQRDEDGKLLPKEVGKTLCEYYLVNHSERRICWAGEVTLDYNLSQPLQNVRGEISENQAEMCLEAEYWTHWSNFPNIQNKTPDVYNYVVESILDAMTDLVTSDKSALAYTYEQMARRLKIVEAAKKRASSNWHVGRFMKEITSERLRNYYDAWCARLDGEQAVLEVPNQQKPSNFMQIISPLLFFIPHAQLLRVRTLIVDETIVMFQWKHLFHELEEEWENTILIATIILAANCAFLAIPIFQRQEILDTHSSPEQIMSYLSLTTSLFGLVLGMVMYRHHKTRKPCNPDELATYIQGQNVEGNQKLTRMQHLFLVWSLPQALVMWSTISFSVAFLIMCFLGTLTVTKIVIGCSALFLGIFTLYYAVRFGSGRELLQCWCKGIVQMVRGRNSGHDQPLEGVKVG